MTGEQALKETIPDISAENAREEAIVSASRDLERFAVLAVQIDNAPHSQETLGEEPFDKNATGIENVLRDLGKTDPVTWVQLVEGRYAVLCDNMSEDEAVTFAKKIQRRFARIAKATVSIGLAVHPFWPFEKETILANAQKALDHASFFGANTVTPFDAVSLNISADKLYQYSDIDGAIEEFGKALMVDNENVNVHNSLGVCYGVQGEYDKAIASFETALKLNPNDVMATYNLGLAHLKKDDREKALSLFLEAQKLDESHPDIACHIGMCYQEMGETDVAITYLEKGVEQGPKGPHLFRVLAECYEEKGRLQEAARAYSNAIKRHPGDAKSLSALGHLYGTLGENLEIAVVLARESTVIEPDNGLFRKRLAELYLQAGKPDEALLELEKAEAQGEDCGQLIAKATTGATLSPVLIKHE